MHKQQIYFSHIFISVFVCKKKKNFLISDLLQNIRNYGENSSRFYIFFDSHVLYMSWRTLNTIERLNKMSPVKNSPPS